MHLIYPTSAPVSNHSDAAPSPLIARKRLATHWQVCRSAILYHPLEANYEAKHVARSTSSFDSSYAKATGCG
jgi:hypothetical protein